MSSAKDIFRQAKELHIVLKGIPGIVQHDVYTREYFTLKSAVTNQGLYRVVAKLFADGHHARAVEEAFKYLNNLVKRRANLGTSPDGSALMKTVFSPKAPVLRLNPGVTQSELDEQQGYMEIFSGCMTGIRNPRAHEHEWEDSEGRALELLTLANHLVERVVSASKV